MSSTDRRNDVPAPGYSQEDWDEVSDNPELTGEQIAQLRPAREMPAEIYALLPKRGRGRPKVGAPKVNITLRIDPALLEAYKAMGAGWQTRMHEALAAAAPTPAVNPKRLGRHEGAVGEQPVNRRSRSG